MDSFEFLFYLIWYGKKCTESSLYDDICQFFKGYTKDDFEMDEMILQNYNMIKFQNPHYVLHPDSLKEVELKITTVQNKKERNPTELKLISDMETVRQFIEGPSEMC